MDPEDESGCEEADEEPEQQKKKKTNKKKKQATKPKAKPKPRVNDGAQNGSLYKAGEFSEERKKFIANAGVPYREASALWNSSERRAELLSRMPRKELIRRPFLKPDAPKPRKEKGKA